MAWHYVVAFLGLWISLAAILELLTQRRSSQNGWRRIVDWRTSAPRLLHSMVAGAIYAAVLTVLLGLVTALTD